MIYDLLAEYGPVAIPWILTFVAGTVGAWVLRTIKAQWARDIVSRAGNEIRDAVLLVQQTYVAAIKAGRADGQLTDDEKAVALTRARDEIRKQLWGTKGLKRLARALGFGSMLFPDSDAAAAWVGSKVEAEVAAQKKLSLQPLAVSPLPPQKANPS